jgi:N utilization substance protein B
MGSRRHARRAVLETLYAWETIREAKLELESNSFIEESISRHRLEDNYADFARRLFLKVGQNLATIDKLMVEKLENWDISRVALIDKCLLRMGICEILFFPDIPRKVTIDEAIELSKIYSTGDSGKFINGILDTITEDQKPPD